MKLDSPLLNQFGGLLGSAAVRWWMRSLDYKVVYDDPKIDPIFPECQGQKIYIFWHEYILFPFYLRGHCNMAMLLSRHRDAEMLSYAAHHMGFEFVRGSTNRGGVAALREMLEKSKDTNLTITPDGPSGPRRQLAPGCVFLASKLGLPIVAMGFGYDRPHRVPKAWDHFALPRYGSRARAVVSGEMYVPANLDRDGIEQHRLHVEQMLNRLTDEAEAWAESGRRRPDQAKLWRCGQWCGRMRDLGLKIED
jgi:lysophospholipid acyltransferase (LPLAT)-like uncharacterized protein